MHLCTHGGCSRGGMSQTLLWCLTIPHGFHTFPLMRAAHSSTENHLYLDLCCFHGALNRGWPRNWGTRARSVQLRVSTLWTPVIVSKMSICPRWAGRVLAESFQLMEKTVSSLRGLDGVCLPLPVATWPATQRECGSRLDLPGSAEYLLSTRHCLKCRVGFISFNLGTGSMR